MRISRLWEELLTAAGEETLSTRSGGGEGIVFQEQRGASCPRGKGVRGEVREVSRKQIAIGVVIRNFRFYSNQSEVNENG